MKVAFVADMALNKKFILIIILNQFSAMELQVWSLWGFTMRMRGLHRCTSCQTRYGFRHLILWLFDLIDLISFNCFLLGFSSNLWDLAFSESPVVLGEVVGKKKF